jgi:membrane protein insertase Oxa1/YidC/SpoIIIJ
METLRDYSVWVEVNELLGLCLVITGFVMMLCSLFFWFLPVSTLWLSLRFGFFLAALAVAFITSTVLIRNKLYAAIEASESTDTAMLEML